MFLHWRFRTQKGRSSSCDRNISERNISKKLNLWKTKLRNTRILTSKYQTRNTHHIPDTQQPSTSKELDILSGGELDSEDESDDDILKE